MKTLIKMLAMCLIMAPGFNAEAQIGNIKAAGKKLLKDKTEDTRTKTETGISDQDGKVAEKSAQHPKSKISLDGENFNIIFSSSPIDPVNPGVSKKKFASGDNVYALAVLPKAVRQYFNNVKPDSKLDVEIFLYSVKISPYEWIKDPVKEQMAYSGMKISGSLIDNKYLLIDLLPDPENTNAYGNDEIFYKKFGQKFDGPAAFAEELSNKLEPGENVIEVLIKLYYQDVATGRFSITGNDFTAYSNLADKLNEAGAGAGMKNARLPKAERNDPAMQKQMIAAVKNSNAWSNKRLDATEILKVNIYDADWHVRRHQISGAILHRYIRAAMAVRTQSGQCAYYIITFQEDYVGGKFQPMKYDGAGDKVMMECANVK
jgi:hypothetical protein